jgi:hypothetical protein
MSNEEAFKKYWESRYNSPASEAPADKKALFLAGRQSSEGVSLSKVLEITDKHSEARNFTPAILDVYKFKEEPKNLTAHQSEDKAELAKLSAKVIEQRAEIAGLEKDVIGLMEDLGEAQNKQSDGLEQRWQRLAERGIPVTVGPVDGGGWIAMRDPNDVNQIAYGATRLEAVAGLEAKMGGER